MLSPGYGITKMRGCLYYTPWIAMLCLTGVSAGVGIWIYFTTKAYDDTNEALKILNVGALNIDRIEPALIATSVFFCVTMVVLFMMAILRSFVERSHDKTGDTGGGTTFSLIIMSLAATCWFIIVVWMVCIIMADTLWCGLAYVAREAVKQIKIRIDQLLVSGLPLPKVPPIIAGAFASSCPSQCLDLTMLSFFEASLSNTCICDTRRLTQAETLFDSAFDNLVIVLIGACLMFLFGLMLLINVCCMFSHTKREKDYIRRLKFGGGHMGNGMVAA